MAHGDSVSRLRCACAAPQRRAPLTGSARLQLKHTHLPFNCFILIYLSINRVLAYFMNVFKDLHSLYPHLCRYGTYISDTNTNLSAF